jgi:hypothetical protein
MNRTRIALLLPLLAVAACATDKKPLTGFDMQPPGSIVLINDTRIPSGGVVVMPVFALDTQQTFRVRLNGQDLVYTYGQGYYDYQNWSLGPGWTGSQTGGANGIPPGTYAVELVDSAGNSWGQSAPLAIVAGTASLNPSEQGPTVLFAHFDGQAGSWTIDPAMQDADPSTDEIMVTNLLHEDIVVERCLIASGAQTSCTPVGTVAPGADLATVEKVSPDSLTLDHKALVIHLASDASQSYQRDLVHGTSSFVRDCEIERILVHGKRPFSPDRSDSVISPLALSSCFGYSSGPQD